MLPEAIDLNDLLKRSAEFVDFELYLSTGVENSLAEQLGLSADEVMCVVQLDDSPIKEIENKLLTLSYSGRVYPPSVDKDGEPLVDPDYKGALEAFFKEEGIDFALSETEVLSFTCSLPSAFLGVSGEEPEDAESEEGAGGPEEEKGPEAEGPTAEEPEPSAGDAADFIKSLEEESEPAPEAEVADEPKDQEKEAEEPKEADKPEETT